MSLLGRCLPGISHFPRHSSRILARWNSSKAPTDIVENNGVEPSDASDVKELDVAGVEPLNDNNARAEADRSARFYQHVANANENSERKFYQLPDPVYDNTDVHRFEPTKRAPIRPGSGILDSNWQPMFFDVENLIEEEEDEFNEDFDPIAEADSQNFGDVDDTEILSPLHHLPIPFNSLDTLNRCPLLSFTRIHQSSKGRIRSMYTLVLVGNGNGLLGLGEGRATEPLQASDKGFAEAVRNIDVVDRFEGRTLWTEMESKFGATRLVMRPRPVGFGLMCSPLIHEVLKTAGIKDASVKIYGSRNKVNVVKCAVRMLHAGHAPLSFGNGLGGVGRKMERGSGMRGKAAIERERGRRILDARTW